jgi:hypothetical protein
VVDANASLEQLCELENLKREDIVLGKIIAAKQAGFGSALISCGSRSSIFYYYRSGSSSGSRILMTKHCKNFTDERILIF